jgi:acetoin utilization deacetylase AcuC-like enzyme
MQAFYSDRFVLPLPAGHRFPMEKYKLLRDQLTEQLPQVSMQQAPEATEGELALAHDPAYIQAIAEGSVDSRILREIGFPWSPAMAARARRSVGGTIAAGRAAMREGIAANLAGGTHHSYADKGGGFCVFNDLAVTARVLQAEWARLHGQHRPLQVAIVDLDVHQGNGTASIFKNDKSVFTLSLHGDKNFPFRKEASHLDIALPDGCTDGDYLSALENALLELEGRFQPGVVLYLRVPTPTRATDWGASSSAMTACRRATAGYLTGVLHAACPACLPWAAVMEPIYAPRCRCSSTPTESPWSIGSAGATCRQHARSVPDISPC